MEDRFLLKTKGSAKGTATVAKKQNGTRAQSAEELQERMEIMRNKMQSKKSKPSERALKKKQEKKMKKAKNQKKILVSAAKSIKNEKVKEGKVKTEQEDTKNGISLLNDSDVKPDVKPAKVYNEEGKIVFSKFEFAARPSQAKKTKKDSESRVKCTHLLMVN